MKTFIILIVTLIPLLTFADNRQFKVIAKAETYFDKFTAEWIVGEFTPVTDTINYDLKQDCLKFTSHGYGNWKAYYLGDLLHSEEGYNIYEMEHMPKSLLDAFHVMSKTVNIEYLYLSGQHIWTIGIYNHETNSGLIYDCREIKTNTNKD